MCDIGKILEVHTKLYIQSLLQFLKNHIGYGSGAKGENLYKLDITFCDVVDPEVIVNNSVLHR